MPDDDRPPFTPPDVPQPNFAGTEDDDGVELANEILNGESGSAPPSDITRERAREAEKPKEPVEPPQGMRELLDERDRRLKAEQELQQWRDWRQSVEQQQRQQAQPGIDPYLQPAEYVEHHVQQRLQQALAPVAVAVTQLYAHNRLNEAKRQFGDEIAEKAYQEFDKAGPQLPRAEFEQVMTAPNPFVAAVQWMRRREAYAVMGDDPAKFEENMRAKIRAELEQELRSGRRAAREPSYEPEPAPSYDTQPRDDAGRFQPRTSLPSVNRIGTANAAAPRGISNLSDEDLVEEILNTPYGAGPNSSRR